MEAAWKQLAPGEPFQHFFQGEVFDVYYQEIRGLTRSGLTFDLALNALASGADEFAGVTFSPGGQVMYANMQSNGITYAIWGPWSRGLL